MMYAKGWMEWGARNGRLRMGREFGYIMALVLFLEEGNMDFGGNQGSFRGLLLGRVGKGKR